MLVGFGRAGLDCFLHQSLRIQEIQRRVHGRLSQSVAKHCTGNVRLVHLRIKQTETCGTIVALPPEDHVEGLERMRSAGKALPGVELAILDAGGKRLPPGEVGEIATRSGSNMVGYWNLPEATAKTLGSDGWLRTGDAGYMDKDGYLYIHDRIKDMIISGGENIYPAEVESALCDHPDVAEAAVIGIPDDKWGEAVKAVVVLKAGKTATGTDIINFLRTRIAGYKTPKSVEYQVGFSFRTARPVSLMGFGTDTLGLGFRFARGLRGLSLYTEFPF